MLSQRIYEVQSRIKKAALRVKRKPADVELISVTKSVPIETIRELISLGVYHIGESNVQSALTKYRELQQTTNNEPQTVVWHMIGHLQTNKVHDAVALFDWIHSVDSLRLAEKIHQSAQKLQKVMPILIEVNISGEKNKYGVQPEDLFELISAVNLLKGIRIEGLMTMAPKVSDPEQTRPYFQHLTRLQAQLREQYQSPYRFPHLSMGMSQDFEIAIEEGATMIRVGSAIFSLIPSSSSSSSSSS